MVENPFTKAELLRFSARQFYDTSHTQANHLLDEANRLTRQGIEEGYPLTFSGTDSYTVKQVVARQVELPDPLPKD